MDNVIPIDGKPRCDACRIPFKPACPTRLCPQCERWKAIAERVQDTQKLLHPPKDA